MSDDWNIRSFITRFSRRFIRELNKYDVVFLSQMGVILAPYIKGTTVFYVTGGDLTQIPFPTKFSKKFSSLKQRIIWEYVGFFQRRGIRKIDKILTQPFFPFRHALSAIGVAPERISKGYFPILMDMNVIKIHPDAAQQIDAYNKAALDRFKFIILHPSRINLDKSEPSVQAGQWKGNDTLFRAFHIFLTKYNVTDACIAMPERTHSPDIGKARKIIKELDIENNVVWLKPPVPDGFPRNELMNFYSIADMVVDEFGIGWFGSIVVEGMACSKPTISYVDEEVMKQLYPWHPILSSNDPQVIADIIYKYYQDRNAALTHGMLSRQWAEEFHSIENGTKIYIRNLKNDLSDIFNLI
jgi:glycosyltransferase involved in cell wall biosynthesis